MRNKILMLICAAGTLASLNAKDRDRDRDRNRDDREEHRMARRNRSARPFVRNPENLPPGLAKRRGNLPPGLERQQRERGHLPPGLENRTAPPARGRR